MLWIVGGIEKVATFATANEKQGSLAEWLGAGLQNRLRRFESARNLQKGLKLWFRAFFYFTGKVLLNLIKQVE